MKKMVLAINIIAFIYACHTGDATAFAVAFFYGLLVLATRIFIKSGIKYYYETLRT